MKENYSHTLARYTKDTQFFFDQEHFDGDFAEVQTRIRPLPQEGSFTVVYHLHRKGETWRVYDVVAENVSLVRNYRTQFNHIINKSSYQGLFEAMDKKLQELQSSAAS
jgi:phospholipid transport system substrate-binding protein